MFPCSTSYSTSCGSAPLASAGLLLSSDTCRKTWSKSANGSRAGLPGRSGVLPTLARPTRRATRHLSWMAKTWAARRYADWHLFHHSFLRYGRSAGRILRALRQPDVDTGRVLRYWCSGDRHHRAKCGKTHSHYHRSRPHSLDGLPRHGDYYRMERIGSRMAFPGMRRGCDVAARAAQAASFHATDPSGFCLAYHRGIRHSSTRNGGALFLVLRQSRGVRLRQRAGHRSIPLRRSGGSVSLVDRTSIRRCRCRCDDYAGADRNYRGLYRIPRRRRHGGQSPPPSRCLHLRTSSSSS